jgi:peroxiredoxin
MKNLVLSILTIITLTSFTPEAGYKVGSKAIDFKLKNINNKIVSLADYSTAKGFIVVFTCNHCPFAVKYEDRIIALNNKYEKLGYPVIAINPNDAKQYPDDSFENMKKRALDKNFTFPYLLDETQSIASAYGATRTPHIYILKKENTDLIVKYIGAIDDNADSAADVKEKYAESAIDALLAGKSVNPDFTKAIGCTIKWKK